MGMFIYFLISAFLNCEGGNSELEQNENEGQNVDHLSFRSLESEGRINKEIIINTINDLIDNWNYEIDENDIKTITELVTHIHQVSTRDRENRKKEHMSILISKEIFLKILTKESAALNEDEKRKIVSECKKTIEEITCIIPEVEDQIEKIAKEIG